MNFKKAEETFFKYLTGFTTYLIILILLLILAVIFYRGISVMSLEMITQTPQGGFYFGKEGGILNAILGSVYLASGATLLALLFGIPIALYMNVYLTKRKKLLSTIRLIFDILWGIPSLIYGAFGFAVMILFGLKASLFAGIITVALFITPIMVRSLDELLKTVPMGLLEASFSLGALKSETAFNIFLRKVSPALITAILLSFGRGIGDAASVLFTTGYTDNLPGGLNMPAATLPLAIFFQLSSPIPEVRERAFAAAFILTLLIFVISILSRFLSQKLKKKYE